MSVATTCDGLVPLDADADAFHKLIASSSLKPSSVIVPNFVKKLDEIPVIDLPPQHPMHIAVSLVDRALVGQFIGLWYSPNTIDNWIQKISNP